MPASSKKATTPASKKAKRDHTPADQQDEASSSTPARYSSRNDGGRGDAAEASLPTPTSSRGRPRRAAARVSYVEEAVDASASPDDAYTPTPEPPTVSTPKRKTPRQASSAKGKAKAKQEDGDFDETGDDLWYGKDPDLEIHSQEGPLSSLGRIHLKTHKPRALRPLWMQGIYHPPFFGLPDADSIDLVNNAEQAYQGQRSSEFSESEGLLWPSDGLAKLYLDPSAYPNIKRNLLKFWFGQVGWVPNEAIYDMGWYPGKAMGYEANEERSKWAVAMMQPSRQNDIDAGEQIGWPFVQPWIDALDRKRSILSKQKAQPFLQDTTTPQRAALRHPTTVMKLTVPDLTMRNRLKRSIVKDPPKRTPARKGGKTDADGMGADDAQEQDDEDAGDDDENAIAAIDANQEPINPNDPKFANITNLGFEEKGPICGDVLHISVGPPGQEVPVRIVKGTSKRLDSLGVVPDEGHLLNVGGHVYDLDWVPVPVHLNKGKEYFVVSAAASTAPMTLIGQKQASPARASLQIWSVAPDSAASSAKGEARLEMVVCHELGAAFKLAWCPAGHDWINAKQNDDAAQKDGRVRRLGLLAGCFADGSLSVFSVPHPDSMQTAATASGNPLYVHLSPLVSFTHPMQTATSLAWAGGELLTFGGSHGWIGVWNIGQILRESHQQPVKRLPPPDYTVRAHRSAITSMTFILLPPMDADGVFLHCSLPTTLFTVALDGLTAYINLSRASSTSIERSRTVHYACAFSPFSGGSLVHEHADGSVAHYSMRPEEMLRSRVISHSPARNLALSASAFHPMVAIGTAHGQVKVANTLRTLRRSQRNHLAVYQMVVDRSTGELMVRHHFEPEIANVAENRSFHIASWHPALAVTAVRWNPNLARCRLLLSGTVVGMVKVDFMKPPYEA